MNIPARHSAALSLLTLASLFFVGCTTTGATSEIEPPVLDSGPAAPIAAAAPTVETTPVKASKQEEGEVPLGVAESEKPDQAPREVIVQGHRSHDEAIHDFVAAAQKQLHDVRAPIRPHWKW